MTGEVEYLLPQFRGGNIAPSAFVSAGYGWDNSSNIMAGIRVYFGNHDKTLIRRQREDDPVAYITRRPGFHINLLQVGPACSGQGCSPGNSFHIHGLQGHPNSAILPFVD